MKTAIATAILILTGGPALGSALGWTPLGPGAPIGAVATYEYAKVLSVNAYVATILDVIDFSGPISIDAAGDATMPGEHPKGEANSLLTTNEVDCARGRWKELHSAAVSGHMGNGTVIAHPGIPGAPPGWMTVGPGSPAIDRRMLRRWCALAGLSYGRPPE
jgi:hypothetical protein